MDRPSYRKLLAHYYNLLIPAEASVLEIGCGSGELLAQLRAARKVGIDLSPVQIAAAQARLHLDFRRRSLSYDETARQAADGEAVQPLMGSDKH